MLENWPITRTVFFEAIGAIGAAIGTFLVWRFKVKVEEILPDPPSTDWNVRREDDRLNFACHSSCHLKISASKGKVIFSIEDAPSLDSQEEQFLLSSADIASLKDESRSELSEIF